jgi:hypothetical protein
MPAGAMALASRPSPSARGRRAGRRRLRALGAATLLVIAGLVIGLSGGAQAPLPLPGIGRPALSGDPFAYRPDRAAAFTARATAGAAHVLFVKSPGGVLATAARVERFQGQIAAAARGSGIDPRLLEGIVFLESAGDPNAIAGSDPRAAAGLTQIVAETGQSLLGMRIDLPASRRLTQAIFAAQARGDAHGAARLLARRARIDDRFDPRRALAATVRYLQLARAHFGRVDLAVESYHMGIGNLQNVLDAYDGGGAVPYVQLYFDTAPDHHAAAYGLLSSFGDDSWTYWWRILAAVQIMQLFRSDRGALARLAGLQNDAASAAEVLHPPDRSVVFADPAALDAAYANRVILPLPRNARELGLAYDPVMGSLAARVGAVPALYRGLRDPALELLIELAARVRALSGGAWPLIVTSTVEDRTYQGLLGIDDPASAGGWSFTIARRYVNNRQRAAVQAMLDRLQSLNLIAWARYPNEIEVTVAGDASRVITGGP